MTYTETLYTAEQIIDDIWELEGVKIKFESPYARYDKLYSEYYDNVSCADGFTIDDLKDKISEFISNCCVFIT